MTWPNRDIQKITQILRAFCIFSGNIFCRQLYQALRLWLIPRCCHWFLSWWFRFRCFRVSGCLKMQAPQIQNFVFDNFVPASGAVVQKHLLSFSSKAKQLTGTGIFFLMVTAIMMMSTIEKSLNSIWRLSQHRNILSKFIIYWSVLTLGPLLMGIGIAITSYLVSLPLLAELRS